MPSSEALSRYPRSRKWHGVANSLSSLSQVLSQAKHAQRFTPLNGQSVSHLVPDSLVEQACSPVRQATRTAASDAAGPTGLHYCVNRLPLTPQQPYNAHAHCNELRHLCLNSATATQTAGVLRTTRSTSAAQRVLRCQQHLHAVQHSYFIGRHGITQQTQISHTCATRDIDTQHHHQQT